MRTRFTDVALGLTFLVSALAIVVASTWPPA